MVAIRADYRVGSRQQTTPLEAAEDAKSALRWVRAHALDLGVDSARIAAAGGSAGGHLAACTAQCPEVHDTEPPTGSAAPSALVLFNPVVRLVGMSAERARILTDDVALALSPILHVRPGDPPTLLLFGTEDPLLLPGQEYLASMLAAGNRIELYTAEGVGHGFFNRSPWLERTMFRADQFLESLGYTSGPPTLMVP
jgi:acetyl esterase/lipase